MMYFLLRRAKHDNYEEIKKIFEPSVSVAKKHPKIVCDGKK